MSSPVAERPARTVADLMTSPAISAGAAETLAATAWRMSDKKVGSVVVLEGNRLIGG